MKLAYAHASADHVLAGVAPPLLRTSSCRSQNMFGTPQADGHRRGSNLLAAAAALLKPSPSPTVKTAGPATIAAPGASGAAGQRPGAAPAAVLHDGHLPPRRDDTASIFSSGAPGATTDVRDFHDEDGRGEKASPAEGVVQQGVQQHPAAASGEGAAGVGGERAFACLLHDHPMVGSAAPAAAVPPSAALFSAGRSAPAQCSSPVPEASSAANGMRRFGEAAGRRVHLPPAAASSPSAGARVAVYFSRSGVTTEEGEAPAGPLGPNASWPPLPPGAGGAGYSDSPVGARQDGEDASAASAAAAAAAESSSSNDTGFGDDELGLTTWEELAGALIASDRRNSGGEAAESWPDDDDDGDGDSCSPEEAQLYSSDDGAPTGSCHSAR